MSTPANGITPIGAGGARWYEVLLGVLLLAALVAVAITLAVRLGGTPEGTGDWREGGRATGFVVVMLVGGALAVLAFVIALVRGRGDTDARPLVSAQSAAQIDEAVVEPRAMPAGARIVGLLLLPFALLVFAWSTLSADEARMMVTSLLYPGAFAVALVLLLDKASRGWHYKSAAEGFREWLLCDLFVFTLVLGLFNTWRLDSEIEYAGTFFDVVHVVLFFVVFLALDRGRGRFRFLLGYGYLLLLPLLLWAWRASNGVELAEDVVLPWTQTLWPFVVLGIVYLVLEIIALLASRGHGVAAVKDALAILVYAGFLLAALPGT